MQIRVRCGCGESSCPEWAVVELQGVVQPQASFAGDIRGLHMGRLCSAPSPSSKAPGYTFTVGYHELAGTKVTLKKPLLVLRKKKASGGDQEPPTTAADVELEVIGVIRHKILFKDRPKALISSNRSIHGFFPSTSVDSD
jgi:chromosome transmission fidelity protein 8